MGAPPQDYSDDAPGARTQDIHEALGQSDRFLDFQERLSRVAQVNRPILLLGERGTGKELAATRIHFLSRRWEGPFIALNCSALSPTLIESELFGHEAGAFTGATGRRRGRFEAAQGGTMLLDEIGSIPLEVQEKILRAVEYGTFERVGSSQPTEVDVRIIAATNADLPTMADEGRFMRDLLDRLSFDVLVLPPLRERGGDIPLLANHFAARMGFELGWEELPDITEDAMEMLETYPWPGNVRELKNVIERAVYRSDDTIIAKEELIFDPFRAYSRQAAPTPTSPAPAAAPEPQAPQPENTPTGPLLDAVRDLETRMLQHALTQSKFNQKKAAEVLGLTYHQFRGLYRKHQDSIDT